VIGLIGVYSFNFGSIRPECVFHVENGCIAEEQLNGDVIVYGPDGEYIKRLSCPNGKKVNSISGYIDYVEYKDSVGIDSFTGYWTVPDAPSKPNGLVYLWNGLVQFQVNTSTVLQPVLQFGFSPAGGGNYWGIASWYVTATGLALYSNLVSVNVGDSIYGNMYQTSPGNWVCVATDKNTGQSSTLNVNSLPAQYYAYVVLEVYVNDCTNLPSQSTTFTQLTLNDGNGPISASWQPQTADQCNGQVTIQNPQTVIINPL